MMHDDDEGQGKHFIKEKDAEAYLRKPPPIEGLVLKRFW